MASQKPRYPEVLVVVMPEDTARSVEGAVLQGLIRAQLRDAASEFQRAVRSFNDVDKVIAVAHVFVNVTIAR